MTNTEPIVLYDISARDSKYMPWSPNTWKARYALNYKGLNYRTEWVGFTEIKDVCIKVGGAPTSTKADGNMHYTLPMIFDPSTKTAVTDSVEIAKYLDKAYPDTPQLFPPGSTALQMAFIDPLFETIGRPLFSNILVQLHDAMKPEHQGYFRTTREARFGKKLEDVYDETNWAKMEQGLGKVAGYLKANGPGNDGLILGGGDKICFADTQLAAILMAARMVCGKDSEQWKRIESWDDGRWKRYLESFDKFATVDM